MSRAVPEWIGKTPDSAIPPRVRVRVFERDGGRCRSCQRKLAPGDKWQPDHQVALINSGENRESNLRVLCDWCHKQKTRADVAQKARSYKRRKRHYGVRAKKYRWACGKDTPFKKTIGGKVVRR